MNDFFSEFHFLRPLWLLGIFPAIALCVLLWQQKKRSTQWQSVIAPQLLRYLLEGQSSQTARWQFSGLVVGWIIACLALAGPAWQRLPQPVHKDESAVVILWDQSPSMLAEDLKPSRLVRARHKITDYLNARQEGLTGLAAYAGEAHIVSPLTDDTETIINLLPALYPDMMPLTGSNVEMGVEKALQLFEDSNINTGEILIVTDEITPYAQDNLLNLLANKNFRISILGVGTEDGAPIPTGSGGFAKDQYSNIVIAKLNSSELRNLANTLNGTYITIRPDNQDVEYLLSSANNPLERQTRLLEREFDSWRDNGPLLALLLLPLIALAFRRGWILPTAFAVMILPDHSSAFEWRDLWLRDDQQGQQSFLEGEHEAAAEQFSNPSWKGAAQYRSDDFESASESFMQDAGADNLYNRGNALAKAGKLQDALKAYEQALELKPDMEDATFNADLVKQLLEQQQQEGSDGEKSDSDEQQQQQNQNQSDSQQAQSDAQQQEGEQDQSSSQSEQQQQDSDSEQVPINEDAASELADRESSEQQNQMSQTQQQEGMEEQQEHQQGEQLLAESEISDSEKQQALEQWLRQIPDDPSGLLRRKFEYEHRQLRRKYQSGEWELPENQAYERW